MGGDLRAEPLKHSELIARRTQEVIAAELAQAETWQRSPSVNAGVTVVAAALVALGFALESLHLVLGELTATRVALLVAGAWLPYELGALAQRLRGHRHPLARRARALDALARATVMLLALVYSGPAAVLFMLLNMPRSFAWQAMPAARVRRTLVFEALTHAGVAAFALFTGRPAMATLVVLTFFAYALGLTTTAGARARAVAARVERDVLESQLAAHELGRVRGKIAREIHDGAGANLLALVLQLRHGARAEPSMASLHAEAQLLLEDLRSVVWSIRGGQGTVGELVKLLDARCGRLCAGMAYERSKPAAGTEHTPVGAVAALTALRVGPELMRFAAQLPDAHRLHFELQVGSTLQLLVDVGATAEQRSSGLDDARRWLDEVGGSLAFVAATQPVGTEIGGQLRASIPLDAAGDRHDL